MSSTKKAERFDTEKNKVEGGTLYLVATPIGNLADLSPRAVKVLSEVDFIAAEDTRNSGHLLLSLGIEKPMVSYFEHNKRMRGEQILARLQSGESCALITDAGTPAISDPGEDMVALCADAGIPVTSIPGPVASIVALTLSGLPTGRFTFEGFLSMNKPKRREHLQALKNEQRTMLFHEAPHKLVATLKDFEKVFGSDRRIALCRELTKRNEEILRLTVGEALALYQTEDPRGEYVVVVEGAAENTEKPFWEDLTEIQHVTYYMENGMTKNDAIKAAARDRGVHKNEIYQRVIAKK